MYSLNSIFKADLRSTLYPSSIDLLDNLTLENCNNTLNAHMPKIDTLNFFSMRFASVHSAIKERCEEKAF